MRKMLTATALAALLTAAAPALNAQDSALEERVFDSENAILDTSIPFAIGAQQAQQNLRGAFGWDTFQEGLVEGVYFRFDPDGYARFSISPRLDTDVFEVICRPRTYSCMARKGSLQVLMDDRGRIQLKFDQITSGDQLVIAEGVTELALPDRILQPLDQRLEALLTAGGDLVHRRGENVVSSTSLQGFSAVVAYLRWVAARQDYTVLPRNWPVPNSKSESATLTQSANWASPMPQPQRIVLADTAPDPSAPAVEALADEMGQLRQEIRLQSATESSGAASIVESDVQTAERLARLEIGFDYLRQDIAKLQETVNATIGADASSKEHIVSHGNDVMLPATPNPTGAAPATPTPPGHASPTSMGADLLAAALAKELGLAPAAAALLASKLSAGGPAAPTNMTMPQDTAAADKASTVLLEDAMVRQILDGIDTTTPPPQPAMAKDDYQTLADYLGSVMTGK